jgi:hypothetical protein
VAVVRVSTDEVVVELTAFEKLEAAHGDLRVARASVNAATVVDDPVSSFRGVKLVGSRLPGSFAIGTFRDGGRIFAVVHRGTAKGVRLELRDAAYDVVVIGCDDPAAVVEQLGFLSSFDN